MYPVLLAVPLLLAADVDGAAKPSDSTSKEQAPTAETTSLSRVDGLKMDPPFVVRSAIAGTVRAKAILGQLQPDSQDGKGVVILSEDPDECALRRKHRARKGARYVKIVLRETVEENLNLHTPPEGGGGIDIVSQAEGPSAEAGRSAAILLIVRGSDCREATKMRARRGELRLLHLPEEKDSNGYGGRFEALFKSKMKVTGRFMAPMCDALSEELAHPPGKDDLKCE